MVFVIKKLRKGLLTAMVFIFVLFPAGCGNGEVQEDVRPAEEKEQELIWYEKHITEGHEVREIKVDKNGDVHVRCRRKPIGGQ